MRWPLVSLASAVAAMAIYLLAIWLPPGWSTTGTIAVGVVVFVIVVLRNPNYWHRRMAAAIIGVWMSAATVAGLDIGAQWSDSRFAKLVIDSVGWPYHVGTWLLVATLLYFDPKNRQTQKESESWGTKRPLQIKRSENEHPKSQGPPSTETRETTMDQAKVVRILSNLAESDMATLIAAIPDARRYAAGNTAVPQQAAALVGWAVSETGPGLDQVWQTAEKVLPNFPQARR